MKCFKTILFVLITLAALFSPLAVSAEEFDRPEALKPLYRKMAEEGARNAVLNNLRIGTEAYALGHKDLAVEAFDKAIASIESVYANSENAAKARSLWYEEGMKDFKGEPYERAMAYFYRGMLFMEEGDYENARASFKSGIIQDAFAEEEQMRCDFALLILLEGWASMSDKNESLAAAAFNELKKLRPDFGIRADDNFLLVVETGKSPRKLADGPGHSELKFRRGKNFVDKRVQMDLGGAISELYPIEDIYWQAASRGGRPIDKVIKGKAVFRQTHEKTATTLTDISSTAMLAAPLFSNMEDIQGASAALGLLGVAQMAIAASARPHADIRYWDNLPDTIHVFAGSLEQGEHMLKLTYKDETGANTGVQFEQRIKIENDRPAVLFVRSPDLTLGQMETVR